MLLLSDNLSERFLTKLEKRFSKNRKSCRYFFENFESNLWLLAYHLDKNPKLQNSFLSLFKLFGKNISNLAYLEDRVLINFKGIQKYGSQIRSGPNYFHYLYPVLGICEIGEMSSFDIRALNDRRRKVGLDSMENDCAELERIQGVFLDLKILR